MNWEAIGAIAETLGAIGVIATLAYLTSQIRQNTKALRRSENNTALQQFSDYRKLLLSDDSLLSIIRKGRSDMSSLNETQNTKFDLLMSEMFHLFRHQYERVDEGLVDTSSWEAGTKPYILTMLSKPGTKKWWTKNQAAFPKKFVSEIDDSEHGV